MSRAGFRKCWCCGAWNRGEEIHCIPGCRRVVESGTEVEAPNVVCPECGQVVVVSVEAWETETGLLLDEGITVHCLTFADELLDETPVDEWLHEYRQSDWQPVIDEVRKWARENLRVKT